MNGAVQAIATFGTSVYIGGTFTTVGSETRNRIAAVHNATALPTAWNPDATGGIPSGWVYALHKKSGTVYAGGVFTDIAGVHHPHFAGILDGAITSVESEPRPAAAPAILAAPNPFHEATRIRFSLATGATADVAVYDVAGRRLRELHHGWLSSGRHERAWDGRDDAGRPLAAGVYFLGVRTGAEVLRSKVYRQ